MAIKVKGRKGVRAERICPGHRLCRSDFSVHSYCNFLSPSHYSPLTARSQTLRSVIAMVRMLLFWVAFMA